MRLVWRHAPSDSPASLELDFGANPPKRVFDRKRYVLGRRVDLCDLTVPMASVGRQHANVVWIVDGWRLEAIGGMKQPIYVNGEECSRGEDGGYQHLLRVGDAIQLGEDPLATLVVE